MRVAPQNALQSIAPRGENRKTGASKPQRNRNTGSRTTARLCAVPAGYVTLDDATARDLTPGTTLYTPHPSAGPVPGGWGLVPVRVESIRESGHGETGEEPQPCVVVDVSRGDARLVYAPEDLLRRKRRGRIGEGVPS